MVTPNTGATPSMSGQSVGAVIVAAGHSRRMDGVDKTLAPLMGRPLIAHSLQAFNDSPLVGTVVLVMSPQNIRQGRRLVAESGWNKVSEVCTGGERRQDSVRRGLEAMPRTDWTVVHDGARPCVDQEMIAMGLARAQETGAAVAAVPVNDTIKSVGPDLVVTGTIKREGLWAAQTPQVFKTDLLLRAHEAVSEDVTDDAAMVGLTGGAVIIFMGSPHNIKVTTPEDIPIAEAVLKTRGVTDPVPTL